MIRKDPTVKYMQTFNRKIYRQLEKLAKARGINVQELLRVEVVPTFLFGPVRFKNSTIAKWQRMGLLKSGSSRKLLGNGHLPEKA